MEDNEWRKIGSDSHRGQGNNPRSNIRNDWGRGCNGARISRTVGTGGLWHCHLVLNDRVTLLPSGVLMISLADHVPDPLRLCGKGEGWIAPLGLHGLLPHPGVSGNQETAQDASLATGPVSRSRFCTRT